MSGCVIARTLLVGLGMLATLAAQQHPATADQKRGSATPPTHAPRPNLPPAMILDHIRTGNAATVAASAAKVPVPAPRPRPAGGGRYLCAVLACADADLDVAELLGLARTDVLVIHVPGPFVQPDAVALLEHYVAEERLALALVLSHPRCATARVRSGISPRQTDLAERVADVRRRATRVGQTLPKVLARSQCELLLASSDRLQEAVDADRLRVLPAEVDPRTRVITWHTTQADELPIAPVK